MRPTARLALGLFVGLTGGIPVDAAEMVETANAQCELHVWGAGRPNVVMPERILKLIPPEQMDKSNPLSNVNISNTANRIMTLADEDLKLLFPQDAAVQITRHAELIDLDKKPLSKVRGRLTESAAPCYKDLILTEAYAILPSTAKPNREAPIASGVAVDLAKPVIFGGDRLVAEFWLRDFSQGRSKPTVVKRKNDSPLPPVSFMTQEFLDAVIVSANLNLRNFAEYAVKKN